jgi:hypothetical protein
LVKIPARAWRQQHRRTWAIDNVTGRETTAAATKSIESTDKCRCGGQITVRAPGRLVATPPAFQNPPPSRAQAHDAARVSMATKGSSQEDFC